ncbi:unnamed protein product [Victoria cruziana]
MEVLVAERADMVFHNKVIDGIAMKRFISRLIDHFGIAYTSHILNQVKTLGFQQATAISISLGIDDLLPTPSKRWLVQDAEKQSLILEKHHHHGNVHAVEKLCQSIEIWYATSEYLRHEMNLNFKMTDPSNLVHIMSYSRARGNASQVHRLVEQMINLLIQSNLCKGLSLMEYTISCYGACKGVVDTVVRTSDTGYLTRRLVEVVQHIVVHKTDCGSTRDIFMSLQKGMTERIFIQMLIGHVLANYVYLEAIGIIVGQSIREPGTQLTLKTFHTGGVFIGGTTEHVRAPSNEKIKFNEDLVHSTRTCHGHPAFLCYVDLYVTIESQDIIHSVNIPPKSFLLVQNDQYVESEQVIAEIRAGTSTFHFKERVQKHIYSDSEGEMHWSTGVYRAPQYTHGNVHFLPKTSHLWTLLGVHTNYLCSDPLMRKGRRISDYAAGSERVISNGDGDLLYPAILRENFYLLAKRRRNRFIIPFQYDQEREKELIPHSCTSITVEIPANGILCRNKGLIEYRRPKESRPKYQMKVDRFFVIPEEVHILPGPSSIMLRNNSIIGVDTRITFNTRSQIAEVRANDLIRYFIRIDLVKPPILYTKKRNDRSSSVIPDTGSYCANTNLFSSKVKIKSLSQHQKTVCTFLNRNKEGQFLIVFSSSNCSRINVLKYHNVIKESIKEKEDTLIPILNLLGPLGTLILDNNNPKHIFQLLKYYLVDENGRISNGNPFYDIIFNLFGSCFLPHDYCDGTSTTRIISLRQFICENICLSKHGTHIKSDTLFIFIYEKSRSGDITHDLSKVEQVLEVCSIDSISMNLEKRVEDWNEHIIRILGIPWGFLIGAELTIAKSHISLVNKIQKVYRFLGVQIHNKQIEIIVRQITSKVLVSEDGMSNVFSPEELIRLMLFWGDDTFGTGFKRFIHCSREYNNIPLEIQKKNFFRGEMRDILLHHRELFCSYIPKPKSFDNTSEQPFYAMESNPIVHKSGFIIS